MATGIGGTSRYTAHGDVHGCRRAEFLGQTQALVRRQSGHLSARSMTSTSSSSLNAAPYTWMDAIDKLVDMRTDCRME